MPATTPPVPSRSRSARSAGVAVSASSRWSGAPPPGAALLLGPEGAFEVVDQAYLLTTATGDYVLLEEEDSPGTLM